MAREQVSGIIAALSGMQLLSSFFCLFVLCFKIGKGSFKTDRFLLKLGLTAIFFVVVFKMELLS